MDRMQPARILCSWDFPGKNMGVGCYFLLQGIFPIQGSNSYLLLGRWILYHWATSVQFSSFQSLSRVQLFVTPLIIARQASLSITNSGVHSNSRPSSRWCHPAISSSVIPFSSCPQSLSASESFPMSQLFTWGGQSTGVSASVSFLPRNTHGW